MEKKHLWLLFPVATAWILSFITSLILVNNDLFFPDALSILTAFAIFILSILITVDKLN